MLNQRNAIYTLIVVALISAFFAFQAKNIEVKYDFELFYPKNDSKTEFYSNFRKRFKNDRDFMLIGLSNDKGVFQQDFLTKVDSLTNQIEKMTNVVSVTSPTNAKVYKILPLYPGIYEQTILRIDQPEFYEMDSLKLVSDQNYVGNVISEDGKSVAIVVVQEDNLSKEETFVLAGQVTNALNQLDFDEKHISGKSLGLTVYVGLIENEVKLFMLLSGILMLIFLFISYRSFWGLWMPTIVVLVAVIWTVGLMAAVGKPLDIISNIIPTLLLVIGISNVIHLLSRFLDRLREGVGREVALRNAIKEVGFATIFTSTTTAIGFLSLTTSNVQPIIEMGIYATIGLLFCFMLSYTMFPALLMLNPKLSSTDQKADKNFWHAKLNLFHEFLIRHKGKVLVFWLIISIAAGFSARNLRVNSYILDGLNEDHPQQQAFQFLEKNFSGSRPFELSIEINNKEEIKSIAFLKDMEIMESYLDTVYGLGSIISPVRIIKNFNRTKNAGNSAYFKLPSNERKLSVMWKQLEKYTDKTLLDNYIDFEHGFARVQGKIHDDGSAVLLSKNQKFEKFMNEKFGNKYTAMMTGAPVMMDNTNAYIVSNVFRGLVGAIVLIGVIMGFLFRSTRIVVISLLTNIIPLLITAGLMAFNGIEMRLSTSIIFIIAFGIAVDDSIHFLSKFKRELSNGKTVDEAIKETFRSAGKAMITTTLILSGGFLSLAFSEFQGTYYLGVYISLTLFIALLADLMILPCALSTFVKSEFSRNTDESIV